MSYQIIATIVLLVCLALYVFSWRNYVRLNYTTAVLLTVLAGFILRVHFSSDQYLHPWDERYHALVAKNMIDEPLTPKLYKSPVLPYDYKDWSGNHIWIHKQPVPLWLMSASMAVFGISEFTLRLPSVLLTTLCIWLIYLIGARLFSESTGYISAFLLSLNGLLLDLSSGRAATDHIDAMFLSFVVIAVFFAVEFCRKKNTYLNILCGISIGMAILTKWLPALIILPVWILIAYHYKLSIREIIINLAVLVFVIIILVLPWQLYIRIAFPLEAEWESKYNMLHITQELQQFPVPFYQYFHSIRINYGELIYLPAGWFIWQSFKAPFKPLYFAITIWFLIPFIFFTIVKTKMPGYLLFTAPALFLMTGEFFLYLKGKRFPRLLWLKQLILILLIILPVRYMIERLKPFENLDTKPEWAEHLKKSEYNGGNYILFNYPRPIEAMFYTGMIVYPQLPEIDLVNKLKSEGYKILINDPEGNLVTQFPENSVIFTSFSEV